MFLYIFLRIPQMILKELGHFLSFNDYIVFIRIFFHMELFHRILKNLFFLSEAIIFRGQKQTLQVYTDGNKKKNNSSSSGVFVKSPNKKDQDQDEKYLILFVQKSKKLSIQYEIPFSMHSSQMDFIKICFLIASGKRSKNESFCRHLCLIYPLCLAKNKLFSQV